MFTLQKRALRFIYFSIRRDHVIPLFLNADILPVTILYYENVCCLMHDKCHEEAPKNITDLFTDTKTVHSYNTRASSSRYFFIKHSKLQIQFKSFARFGARPRTWNEIPTSLREKPKNLFKTKLHGHYWTCFTSMTDDYVDISQIGKAVKHLMDK